MAGGICSEIDFITTEIRKVRKLYAKIREGLNSRFYEILTTALPGKLSFAGQSQLFAQIYFVQYFLY